MEVIAPMKRLLNIQSDWDLAVKACAIMGESNPIWIRSVANALEHGALPQIVVAAYNKLKGGSNEPSNSRTFGA